VCLPALCLRRQLTVFPSITIGDLKQLMPTPDCDLLHRGLILTDSAPLSFCPLSDGAMLVGVSKDGADSRAHWARVTRDPEAFEEQMASAGSRAVALEAARFRDLRLQRICERPRSVAKLRTIARSFGNGSWNKGTQFPTRLPAATAVEPSSEPLGEAQE
jgi:hypothetical protein